MPPCSCSGCYNNSDNSCGHTSSCYTTAQISTSPAGTVYAYWYFCYYAGFYGQAGCVGCVGCAYPTGK